MSRNRFTNPAEACVQQEEEPLPLGLSRGPTKNPFVGKQALCEQALAQLQAMGLNPAMLAAWQHAKETIEEAREWVKEMPDEPITPLEMLEVNLDATLDGGSRDFVRDCFEDTEWALKAMLDIDTEEA